MSEALEEKVPNGCGERCNDECCSTRTWFGLEESGKQYVIDVAESFGPQGTYALLFKSIFTVFGIGVFFQTLYIKNQRFFFAFQTHQALAFATIYFPMSLLNSVFRPGQPKSPSEPPSLLVRFTWFFFVLGAFAEITVSILYWTLDYDWSYGTSGIGFNNTMTHGGITLLILIDGLVINRIPVRFNHFYICLSWMLFYALWTVAHAYLNIGNPTRSDEDPETNDDVMYDVIDWKNETLETGILIAILFFAVSPLFFTLLWLISLYSCCCSCNGSNRRYLSEINAEDTTTNVNMYENA